MIALILSSLATAVLAYGLHSLDVNRIEANARASLEAQSKVLVAQCQKDKQITEEASNGYQEQLAQLNNRLAALKRVQPSKCIPVSTAGAASGRDDSPAQSKPVGENGVTSDVLYDFAGEAEQYRLQLIACQGFIRKVWETKKAAIFQ